MCNRSRHVGIATASRDKNRIIRSKLYMILNKNSPGHVVCEMFPSGEWVEVHVNISEETEQVAKDEQ